MNPAVSPLPQAVLWDLDGTLIDSEPLWMAAEEALMHAHGIAWTHEDAMQMVGNALPASAQLMIDAGVQLGPREIIDTLISDVMEGLRREVPWRPGARELLAALREAGIPQALVTMSETVMARTIVEGLGFDPFEVKVTGDLVENGKPHPEPYLTAVERLEQTHGPLDKRRVVALEDSNPGTASAIAAGVVTVGVPLHAPLPRLADIHLLMGLEDVTPAHLGEIIEADAARRGLGRPAGL